ncbi:hypothetical protein IHE44_0011394 [Lamprotornis superbus]|uniref:Uncharacterized protein n=1 Tax=Lamprotornis superbus TaxID=245042 RepID=A0A835NIU9_9PASS|nr:hypothetical protein IHE44_0011394 [Lamprotornis superbus]
MAINVVMTEKSQYEQMYHKAKDGWEKKDLKLTKLESKLIEAECAVTELESSASQQIHGLAKQKQKSNWKKKEEMKACKKGLSQESLWLAASIFNETAKTKMEFEKDKEWLQHIQKLLEAQFPFASYLMDAVLEKLNGKKKLLEEYSSLMKHTKLKIFMDFNANKIMTTKIKEDKSIKICGNHVLLLFSNSSKMHLNIISTKPLIQLREKSFRRPKISENYPHCLCFHIAKHLLVQFDINKQKWKYQSTIFRDKNFLSRCCLIQPLDGKLSQKMDSVLGSLQDLSYFEQSPPAPGSRSCESRLLTATHCNHQATEVMAHIQHQPRKAKQEIGLETRIPGISLLTSTHQALLRCFSLSSALIPCSFLAPALLPISDFPSLHSYDYTAEKLMNVCRWKNEMPWSLPHERDSMVCQFKGKINSDNSLNILPIKFPALEEVFSGASSGEKWPQRHNASQITNFCVFRSHVFSRAIKGQDLSYFVHVKDLVKSLVIGYDTEAICRSWANSFMKRNGKIKDGIQMKENLTCKLESKTAVKRNQHKSVTMHQNNKICRERTIIKEQREKYSKKIVSSIDQEVVEGEFRAECQSYILINVLSEDCTPESLKSSFRRSFKSAGKDIPLYLMSRLAYLEKEAFCRNFLIGIEKVHAWWFKYHTQDCERTEKRDNSMWKKNAWFSNNRWKCRAKDWNLSEKILCSDRNLLPAFMMLCLAYNAEEAPGTLPISPCPAFLSPELLLLSEEMEIQGREPGTFYAHINTGACTVAGLENRYSRREKKKEEEKKWEQKQTQQPHQQAGTGKI